MGKVTITREARADIKNTWGNFKTKKTDDFVDMWVTEHDGKWYLQAIRFKDGNVSNCALDNLESVNPLEYLEFEH